MTLCQGTDLFLQDIPPFYNDECHFEDLKLNPSDSKINANL